MRRRIELLFHARDRKAARRPYQLFAVAEAWRRAGHDVVVRRGVEGPVDADVVVNHVDLTVTPPEYVERLARFPVAINGRAVDLSKRRLSRHIVRFGDRWTGPVVVKTDRNYGGRREEEILSNRLARWWRSVAEKVKRPTWRTRRSLPTDDYAVFPSPDAVPPEVYGNDALVVERFLPEREGDLYALRTLLVLGDRTICRRVLSPQPIVKAARVVRREEVEPHPDALAAAARIGLDHGKLDYVVREEGVVVFDANRTPAFGPRIAPDARDRIAAHLAEGLESLVRRVPRGPAEGASPQAPSEKAS
jgi:hypothetical protein